MAMDRDKAQELWCEHCQCHHPRTKEYYYFSSNGNVLGCIKKRRQNSQAWNQANRERKHLNDARCWRRRRIRRLARIYPGRNPGK